jgi:radical SAM superfamily enzyme YgiQ (UPF0313 family)
MRHIVIFNQSIMGRRSSGAYKAAEIFRDRGFDTEIVEFLEHWNFEDLKNYLRKIISHETVGFGFSYTWMTDGSVSKLIGWLRETYPKRKYFAGGQQPFQEYEGFDLVCTGFFEKAADDVIDYLFNDKLEPPKHKMIHNDRTMLVNGDTDYPSHSLPDLTVRYSYSDFISPHEALTIELSRGCRFKCKYCSYAFLGLKNSTYRNKENVKAELIYNYETYGTKNYIIADPTVNDDDDKLRMLGEVVAELPFVPNFSAFVRVDLVVVRPYQMELMAKARIWAHFYGIETFHPVAAKAVGKGMPPQKIKKCLKDMRRYFLDHLGLYRGSIGLIAGLPGEDIESWKSTQRWLKKHWKTESWHWWPLDITDDSDNDNINSLFSRNPEKYGYRPMKDNNKIEAIKQQFSQFGKLTHHKVDDEYFFWQNDTTDFYEAVYWCSEMFQPENIWTYDGNFYLMNRLSSVDNLQDALKLKLNIWDGKTIDKDTDPESHTIYCKRKIESKHNQ